MKRRSVVVATMVLLAAVVAFVRGRPAWSWAALAAAVLVKPLAYPFVPLLAFATLWRYGWSRVVGGAAAALAVVGVALVPFAWIGRLVPVRLTGHGPNSLRGEAAISPADAVLEAADAH